MSKLVRIMHVVVIKPNLAAIEYSRDATKHYWCFAGFLIDIIALLRGVTNLKISLSRLSLYFGGRDRLI